MNFSNNIQDFFGLNNPRKNTDEDHDPQDSKDLGRGCDCYDEHPSKSDSGFSKRDSFFEDSSREFTPRGFSVFSDPIEMHRYFEHQMNEILRNFGIQTFGEGNSFFHSFGMPSIEGPSEDEVVPPPSGDLRDQYLKPGYEHPNPSGHEGKVDKDVDGRLNLGDLDSIFGGHKSSPYQPDSRFFGQCVTSKTIRRPDGSIETHRTVRDNEGNEETTITKKMGDKEYTVTKRRNKNGEEEQIENSINMDVDDINRMLNIPRKQEDRPHTDGKPPNWFPFDKFFK